MDVSPPKLLLVAAIAAMFSFGMYDYLIRLEPNSCEMTYMYQQPIYMNIPMMSMVTKLFPTYGLYLYGEGSRDPVPDGIPVLFIPGNAGSHKQVRSLASVALKKVRDKPSPFHFSYFVVDFNEELSAVSGQIIQRQTEFTFACIKKIFSMYKGKASTPTSVVLVGHSMGGFIARAVFTLPTFNPKRIHTIITQATPHQAPVIALDSKMASLYEKVNDFWRQKHNTSLKHVTVFSSGGGWRDVLVRTGLTSLNGIVSASKQTSTLTMSVPNAWVSADHLCHVWCKQIVMATTRALFDSVDKTTKQLSTDAAHRVSVFRHHFVTSTGQKRYKSQLTPKVALKADIKRERRQRKSWQFHRNHLKQTRYSLVDVGNSTDKTFVAVTSIKSDAWLGGCLPDLNATLCAQAVNLAGQAMAIPPLYSDKKVIHLTSEQLQLYEKLVVVLPKSKTKVELTADLYTTSDRHITHQVPDLLYFLRMFPGSIFGQQVVFNRSAENAVFYNISLAGLEIPLQAYVVRLRLLECVNESSTVSLMKLHVPWSGEHTYSQIRPDQNGSISLKLHTGKSRRSSQNAQLHLYLDPTCSYQLTMGIAWSELFGQFVRFYLTSLPVYLFIQLLMALSWQLKMLARTGSAPSFLQSQQQWAQPWRVVGSAILLKLLISYPEDKSLVSVLRLPHDDSVALMRLRLWYSALPIMLYLVGYALAAIFAVALQAVISVVGSVALLCCRWCCQSLSCAKLASCVQLVLHVAAVAIAVCLTGTVGLCIVAAIQLVKVLAYYVKKRCVSSEVERTSTTYNVNLTLLQLLLVALTLNAGTFAVWFKALGDPPAETAATLTGDSSISTDWSLSADLLLTVSTVMIQHTGFPYPVSDSYTEASHVLFIVSVLAMLYATVSVYRISYFLASCLVTVALPTVIAYYSHPS